nr:hypothetical protein [Tanacetum cinerariifolium]
NVLAILNGDGPRLRFTLDAVKARVDCWLASKAFFDGDIREPPPILPLLVLKTDLLCLTRRTMFHSRLVFSGDTNREVSVNETFHVQTDDELTEKELKQIKANDQAIQTILLSFPEDIYAAVDSCETAQEIWLRVQQMMKGSDIGIQEKKAKLFNEWERFTSNDEESNESYYHRFLKLMNDLKWNKHFPEKIASNLKFLNNLQPEWSRHVTIVHHTKVLPTAYYTQLYDFLKYNQKEVDELKVERLAKTQDPLALMASSNNPYTFPVPHQDQPSFNQNYMQQLMPNHEDITNPIAAMNMALALMAKAFKLNYSTPTNNNQRIPSNPRNRQIAQSVQDPRVQNIRNQNGLIGVFENANHNLNGNGNLIAARAEGNTAGHNGNQIMCYNCRGVVADLDEIEEVNANCILMTNLQQASTSGTQTNKAPVYDSDGSAEKQQSLYDGKVLFEKHDPSVVHDSEETLQLAQEKSTKFVRDFKSLAKEADESLAKHKALELEIEPLLRAIVSQNIMSVVQNNYVGQTSNLQTELKRTKKCFENCIIKKENEYAKLWNDWYKKCEECKFDKISYDKAYNDMQQKIERLQAQLGDLKGTQTKTIIASLQNKLENTIYENAKLKAQLFNKVSDQNDNTYGMSANTKFAKQSILGKPPKDGKTYALSKPGRKACAYKVRASVRTKPITVSQPPVFTKKVVNSDSNGLSSTRVDNTKTRRPRPRSNTKNDRVPSASKSICNKNKGVEVEERHRNLLLSKNKKHMSSACNNVKLATQNVKSKVVCTMCKQCLISVNHDVCLLNYVNGKTSRGKKQKANVSIKEKQKKQLPKLKKTKKVGFIERLDTPKPSKPRSFLRWSPTGRMFDLRGKIIASSESESQFDCSKGDNACTSNPLKSKIKRSPNLTFSLAGNPTKFMFLGTVRFGNDHVAAILGFGDLQWGNILIIWVYFVKGLGHNLFSVGQLCDSNLEVAFRRNACFVRNLEGVDLLSGNRSTNLYTINLHDMASASLICLIARASSTKSWLWHQHLSYLNFDTINDLAKNDIVLGLPKFKYHKEHLCPSSSINGKRYVLVIVDDYSLYTWVQFLRSKDEAPEVIKTFLERISILLQSPVIIIRTDNGTEFKNQVLKEYVDSVSISHQVSSVRTPQQNRVVERRNRTLVEALIAV